MRATYRSCMPIVMGMFVLGCGDKTSEAEATADASGAPSKPKGSASAAAAASGASSAGAGASASATAAVSASAATSDDPLASFKELDMSGFHKLWKFSVKAPEGATITQGSSGPRISKDKEFGIEFSFADTQLANTVDDTKNCASYDQRCAVLERTNDLVEHSSVYTSAGAKPTYAFHMLVRPGGSLMGCKSTIQVEDRAKLDVLKKACSSIAKK